MNIATVTGLNAVTEGKHQQAESAKGSTNFQHLLFSSIGKNENITDDALAELTKLLQMLLGDLTEIKLTHENQSIKEAIADLPTELQAELAGLMAAEYNLEELLGALPTDQGLPAWAATIVLITSAIQEKKITGNDSGQLNRLMEAIKQTNEQVNNSSQQLSGQLNRAEAKALQPLLDRSFQSLKEEVAQQNAAKATDLLNRLATGVRSSQFQTVAVENKLDNSTFQQPLTSLHQYAIHVQNTGNESLDQQRFIFDLQKVLSRSNLQQVAPGKMGMSIKLYPENLGSISIELLVEKGVLTARLTAVSAAAKELLDSQLHQLRQAFLGQNLQVDKIEVFANQSQFKSFNQSHHEQNQGQEQAMNESQEQEEADSESEESFSEMLMNLSV